MFWYAQFKMLPILSVKLNIPILTSKHQFGIVLVKNTELYRLGIHSSQAFHGEFLHVKDLHKWSVDSSCNDESLIRGDFHLCGCSREIEILDKLNSISEFLIVFQARVSLRGMLKKFSVSFTLS